MPEIIYLVLVLVAVAVVVVILIIVTLIVNERITHIIFVQGQSVSCVDFLTALTFI